MPQGVRKTIGFSDTAEIHGSVFFFFQAEDGIRDLTVTGVQTCALPICVALELEGLSERERFPEGHHRRTQARLATSFMAAPEPGPPVWRTEPRVSRMGREVGRAGGRGRGEISGGAGSFKKKKRGRWCGG